MSLCAISGTCVSLWIAYALRLSRQANQASGVIFFLSISWPAILVGAPLLNLYAFYANSFLAEDLNIAVNNNRSLRETRNVDLDDFMTPAPLRGNGDNSNSRRRVDPAQNLQQLLQTAK